jgi:hypothetical protein
LELDPLVEQPAVIIKTMVVFVMRPFASETVLCRV